VTARALTISTFYVFAREEVDVSNLALNSALTISTLYVFAREDPRCCVAAAASMHVDR